MRFSLYERDVGEVLSEEPPVEQVVLQQNGTNFPAIWSEEGKYLASVLGDALVKGLSLVSQERPSDPVEYLSNFLRKYKEGDEEVADEENPDVEAAAAAALVAGAVAAGGVLAEGDKQLEGDAAEKNEDAAPEETETQLNGEEEEEPAASDEQAGEQAGEPEAAEEPDAAEEPEDAQVAEQEPAVEEEVPPPAEDDVPMEEAAEPPVVNEEMNEPEAVAPAAAAPPTEEAPENESSSPTPHVPSTPVDNEPPAEESSTGQEADAPPPPPEEEESLNTELTEAYDKLEDALEEEESSASPFDPEKEEQAERAMLETTKEPGEDGDVNAFSGHNSTRDESGQSVLHFACTRPGGGSTIMAFLQNPSVNLAWRDANLRTARDVASNLGRAENVRVIDNYIVMLAQRGDTETIEALMIDGYEHLADVEDSSGVHVVEVADNAEHKEVANMIRSAPEFRERVERTQRCVRSGDVDGVKSLVTQDKRVGYAINPKTGRNALHVAVLCEEIGIVKWLAENCAEAVKGLDNLERTCLHLSMGVDKCEKIVRILVRAGAKRVVKDLRDRQPSYYFMHKDEISELQTEERAQ